MEKNKKGNMGGGMGGEENEVIRISKKIIFLENSLSQGERRVRKPRLRK